MVRENKINKILLSVLVCSCVFVESMILCELSHVHLWNVYLPSGWCSDEVSYYKLIEAVVDCGYPRGYWGYYESSALVGSFGNWVPFCLWPYCLFGKIFGWNVYSPIIFNSLFLFVSILLFQLLVKPTLNQKCFIILAFITMPWIARYSLSMMLEPFVVSMEILFAAYFIRLTRSYKKSDLLVLYIIIFLLFVERPYFALLLFFPLYLYDKKQLKNNFIISFLVFACFCILYIIARHYFSAAYIGPFLYASPTNTYKNMIYVIHDNLIKVVDLIINGGMTYGYAYVLFLITLVMAVADWIQKKKEKTRTKRIPILLVFFMLGIFVSVVALDEPSAGSRHIFAISVMCQLILLISLDANKKILLMIIANILAFCIYCENSDYFFSIPDKDTSTDKLEWSRTLENAEWPGDTDILSWNNTLVFDASAVDYNYAYYLPSWMGIQLTWSDFFSEESVSNMKSGYILTSDKGVSADLCHDLGWNMLVDDKVNHICILRRP